MCINQGPSQYDSYFSYRTCGSYSTEDTSPDGRHALRTRVPFFLVGGAALSLAACSEQTEDAAATTADEAAEDTAENLDATGEAIEAGAEEVAAETDEAAAEVEAEVEGETEAEAQAD